MEQPFANQLLVAGDTWEWEISLSEYPATDFTLKYLFRGASDSKLEVVATANGSGFKLKASGVDTKKLQAGTARFQMMVEKSGDRTTLGVGSVEILPNLADLPAGSELRSWVKVTLDAVRAVLQGRGSRMDAEYQINGRMLRLMDPKELMWWETRLAARYEAELAALRGSGTSNTILPRFC